MHYLSMFAILISWQFFVSAFQRGADSIASNQHLIHRIKFPLILLPISVVLSSLIDAFVNLLTLFVLMVILKKIIFLKILCLLSVLLISSIFISALCILSSLLVSFWRDVKHAIPFLTRISLVALPILYSEDIFSCSFKLFYEKIPLVWMILKTKEIFNNNFYFLPLDILSVVLVSIIFLFIVYIGFKKFEPLIVDYI